MRETRLRWVILTTLPIVGLASWIIQAGSQGLKP
jgi:hypothetical protein